MEELLAMVDKSYRMNQEIKKKVGKLLENLETVDKEMERVK